jgi:vitamin B12 transporter
MVLGATTETETAFTSNQALPRRSSTLYVTGDASQSTQSIYAIHQIPLGDHLSLSLGGRVDHTEISDFATWRTTAAYLLSETDTKLRASVGTGAKSPSLYQRFSVSGSNNLQPEKNIGIDAGIDQDLLNKRMKIAITVFDQRYNNLIDWHNDTSCTTLQNITGNGCFYNINKAHSYGLEQAIDIVLRPDILKLKSSYTFQIAQDEASHLALLRRPQHQGMVSLVYTGFERMEIEPRLYLVGHRADSYWDDASFSSIRTRLAPYARFDLRSSYKITESVSAYIRAENLTNAHYQDIYNYGITGRAFYVGAKATW